MVPLTPPIPCAVWQAEQEKLRAAAHVSDRMAGSAGICELRDDIEKISGGNSPRWKIAKDRISDFPRAGTVATQAERVQQEAAVYDRTVPRRRGLG